MLLRLALAASLAAAAVPAALAATASPSPGEASALHAGTLRFTAARDGGTTLVRAGGSRTRLPGSWGFPRVTFDGAVEGLSADRSALVLAQRTDGRGTGSARFALLDPRTLHLRRTISVPGRFAFDALSPDAARLYLVEYVSVVGELRYRVRSYDVAAGRLERGVIADKRSGWTAMQGEPLTRATSADGTWVYTLYGNDTRPFLHALNAAEGYAVCVDLPLAPAAVEGLRLRLAPGRILLVTRDGRVRAAIDRQALRVLPQP